MRKSNDRSRTRLLSAGIAAAAVSAVIMVAPEAAWAAGTASPYVVAPGAVATITDASYAYDAGDVAEFEPACGLHYTNPNTSSVFAQGAANTGATTSIAVTVPDTIVTAANGAGKAYNLCVYDTTSTTTSVLQTSAPVFVAAVPTVTPIIGPTAGTNLLTVTTSDASPVFTTPTAVGVNFTTGNCPTTYGTQTTGMAATDVNKVSNTQVTFTVPSGVTTSTAGTTAYNICFYNGTATSGALLTSVPYTVSKILLSQNSGPTNGGNGITLDSVDTSLFGGITPGIVFVQAADCTGQAHYTTTGSGTVFPVTAANTRKLSDSRLALTVPASITNGNWQACIYDQNTDGNGTLIAASPYRVAAASIPLSVSPAAGPTTGNTKITVYGTDFPLPADTGTITATLGGVPLTDVTKKTATSFTAVTPPHSADPAATLVVTTDTGTKALQNAFAYQNALTLRPSTAPNTTPAVDVEVGGAGFLGYNFASAAIYLVAGTYNPASNTAGQKANGPVTNCGNVLVISDSSVICTLTLNRRLDTTGSTFNTWSYQNITGTGGTTGPTGVTTVGSKVVDINAGDGSFSWRDLGQPITVPSNTEIPAGTTVAAILGPTRILLSKAAIAAGTPVLTIGNTAPGAAPVNTIGDGSTTGVSAASGSSTLTSNVPFSTADIGRVFYGVTGITNGTTITAVAPSGLSATLSAATTGLVAANTAATLFPAAPVPNGAYTMTVVSNGALDANTSDPTYEQSAVTSGATFTVAPA
jgi:hypothetical protein